MKNLLTTALSIFGLFSLSYFVLPASAQGPWMQSGPGSFTVATTDPDDPSKAGSGMNGGATWATNDDGSGHISVSVTSTVNPPTDGSPPAIASAWWYGTYTVNYSWTNMGPTGPGGASISASAEGSKYGDGVAFAHSYSVGASGNTDSNNPYSQASGSTVNWTGGGFSQSVTISLGATCNTTTVYGLHVTHAEGYGAATIIAFTGSGAGNPDP